MTRSNIVAIVQARMGSTRLPNKMMLYLNGFPIIEWVYQRVNKSKKLDQVIYTVPDTLKDQLLASYIKKCGGQVVRGSENDVVDRYYQAAKISHASHIVRICADNPLICPEAIDELIFFYQENPCDYAYNHIPKNNCYPDGIGAEIVSFEMLEEIAHKASKTDHREHVFNYIWDNEQKFNIKTFDPSDAQIWQPKIKLDIDSYRDYEYFLSKPIKIDMKTSEILPYFK
jgi:spore coat polysaccharide biosynthesis protein SpsF